MGKQYEVRCSRVVDASSPQEAIRAYWERVERESVPEVEVFEVVEADNVERS